MDSAGLKRLGVTLVGAAAVVANKKWGLNLGDVEIEALAAMVLGFLAQSSWKETALDKAEKAHALEMAKLRPPEAVVDSINARAGVAP